MNGELTLKCPNCGNEVSNENANFCPICGNPLHNAIQSPPLQPTEKQQAKRSGFLTASGILTIIASSIIMLFGIIYLISGLQYLGYSYYYNYYSDELISGIVGVLGFSFGLTAGILTLKRSSKAFAFFGVVFLMVSSIASPAIITNYNVFGYIFTVPVVLFSILSIVFLGVANDNFETNSLRRVVYEQKNEEEQSDAYRWKHKDSLIAGIWIICVGVIVSLIGYEMGSMFSKGTAINAVGLVLLWIGLIEFIVGIFAIITSLVRESF